MDPYHNIVEILYSYAGRPISNPPQVHLAWWLINTLKSDSEIDKQHSNTKKEELSWSKIFNLYAKQKIEKIEQPSLPIQSKTTPQESLQLEE